MNDPADIPVFASDAYDELGVFLRGAVPDRSRMAVEPKGVCELPGRRILLDGEPLCRVVPDPSDPRPFPMVINRLLDAVAVPG